MASSQDFAEEMARTGAHAPVFVKADVLAGPPSDLESHPSTSCHPERSEGSFMQQYDIIVSNPPYIKENEKESMHANVLDWEPHTALFVPDSDPLLFYRAIAEKGLALLKPGGRLYFEINRAHGNETMEMLAALGYTGIELCKDFAENDRMIRAVKNKPLSL